MFRRATVPIHTDEEVCDVDVMVEETGEDDVRVEEVSLGEMEGLSLQRDGSLLSSQDQWR